MDKNPLFFLKITNFDLTFVSNSGYFCSILGHFLPRILCCRFGVKRPQTNEIPKNIRPIIAHSKSFPYLCTRAVGRSVAQRFGVVRKVRAAQGTMPVNGR